MVHDAGPSGEPPLLADVFAFKGLVPSLGLVEMRLDGVEDAQHPKANQPKAENTHADILRRRGGEKAEQSQQAVKGEEENAGTGHGGGSFPG